MKALLRVQPSKSEDLALVKDPYMAQAAAHPASGRPPGSRQMLGFTGRGAEPELLTPAGEEQSFTLGEDGFLGGGRSGRDFITKTPLPLGMSRSHRTDDLRGTDRTLQGGG